MTAVKDDGPDACPFCRRLAKGDFEQALGEAVTFADKDPQTPGHTLVVPRRHEADLNALTGEEMRDMWLLARETAAALDERLHPDAFNIGINLGREAGQEVSHLHIHVLPRFAAQRSEGKGVSTVVEPR
jgi:ATP adenylyltransferase